MTEAFPRLDKFATENDMVGLLGGAAQGEELEWLIIQGLVIVNRGGVVGVVDWEVTQGEGVLFLIFF